MRAFFANSSLHSLATLVNTSLHPNCLNHPTICSFVDNCCSLVTEPKTCSDPFTYKTCDVCSLK